MHNYRLEYLYEGVRYVKECDGYDFDVSVIGCLTIYFNKNSGRIIMPAYKISEFKAECIWRI